MVDAVSDCGHGRPFESRRTTVQLPLGITLRVAHADVVPGRQFRDFQVRGPFLKWSHVHRVVPEDGGCRMEDEVTVVPFAPLLDRLLRFRHQRLRRDLEAQRHAPLRIGVTGTTGLVGAQLCAFLSTGGDEVHRLLRRPARLPWPGDERLADATLEGLDAVVHLAGEPVANVWTRERKKAILQSRIETTRAVAEKVARAAKPPRVLVVASAVGYYGVSRDGVADESADKGSGFLADVVEAWEAAAQPARDRGIRVVHLRIGVVLSAVLLRLALPTFLGVGAILGSGRQPMPWVALDDVLGAVLHAIHHDIGGRVNVVAPRQDSHGDVMHALGRVLHRPVFIHVPAWALRLALGEFAESTLLNGVAVRPQKLLESGYTFALPDLDAALAADF